jgi:uncharacterized Zn finger protein (UPF0148 family)
MALNRIPCPECGAGLKSASGFTVGQTVCCPKCETYFNVEEPAEDNEDAEEKESPKKVKSTTPSNKAKAAGGKKPVKAAAMSDDDDDDREDDEDYKPKKKKKKKKHRDDDDDDDEERSYKNSPLRYAILGILVIVMLVGAFFLYKKYQKEHSDDTASTKTSEENSTPSRGPAIPAGGGGPNAKFVPAGANKNRPQSPKGGGVLPQGKSNDSLIPGGILGSNPLTPAEKTKYTQQLKTQLIGTWKADLGDGVTAKLEYISDGRVMETVTTPKGATVTMGNWTATDVANRNTLLVSVVWSGVAGKNKPIQLVFEDDELQHPVLGQGVIGIFRKA